MINKFDLKNLENKILKIIRKNPGITDENLLGHICSSEAEKQNLYSSLEKYATNKKPLYFSHELFFRLNGYMKMLKSHGKIEIKIESDSNSRDGPITSTHDNHKIKFYPT